MKTLYALALILAVTAVSARGGSIQILRLTMQGEHIELPEIAALIEARGLTDPKEFTVAIDAKGAFREDRRKDFEFASEYGADGLPTKWITRQLGDAVSGTVEGDRDEVTIVLTYSSTSKTSDSVTRTERGDAATRPVFQVVRTTTSVEAKVGRWMLFRVAESDEYIALKVTHSP